jgi:hypothetical protein
MLMRTRGSVARRAHKSVHRLRRASFRTFNLKVSALDQVWCVTSMSLSFTMAAKKFRPLFFRHFKIVVYLTSLCVNWAFFGTRGPLKRSFHSRFKMAHACQKRPNLHTNGLNTTFFCSTSPLKAPNRLKPLKLA